MPTKTFIEAIREGLREEMARDETVIVLGEDVGKKGGVFLATDGLWAEFGDDRVIDTPLTESQIIGTSIGAVDQRAAAGRRDPVRRLHLSRRSTSSCPRRPGCATGRTTATARRWSSGRRTAAASTARCTTRQSVEAFFTHVPGLKVVIPSTPYDAKGLLRSCDPRRRPGAVLRAQEDVPERPRRRPGRRVHRAARQGPGHPSRDAGHGHRLRADGPLRARGGRPGRRGGDQRRGRRPADARARSTRRRSSTPSGRPASASSSTRTTGSAATGRRSARSSPRRRSTTSTGRSRGSPARTSRAFPYNHVLEDWFMVNPEKIADGIRKLAAY